MSTTMLYIHVLNRGGQGIHSPADRLCLIGAGARACMGGIGCQDMQRRLYSIELHTVLRSLEETYKISRNPKTHRLG
jgi:hypothetical protein